jgi:hypothetical protein
MLGERYVPIEVEDESVQADGAFIATACIDDFVVGLEDQRPKRKVTV